MDYRREISRSVRETWRPPLGGETTIKYDILNKQGLTHFDRAEVVRCLK